MCFRFIGTLLSLFYVIGKKSQYVSKHYCVFSSCEKSPARGNSSSQPGSGESPR